jgi:diacylglycerol kinase (ATP)
MDVAELQRARRRRGRASPASGRRSLLLLLNGHASEVWSHTAEAAISALRRAGAQVEAHVTYSVQELVDLWPSDPDRRVVLVGGDGTLHAVANLTGPQPEIALIPAGSANNVCRSLGIPLDLGEAAALATRGQVRPIDLIEASTDARTYNVTEGVSVGFLAEARARYHGRNSGDAFAALRAGADALAAFHPLDVCVTTDHASEELQLAQLFVANLPLYAFGLRIAPHADPEDAMLDLVGIERAHRAAIVSMLVELRRGTVLHHPGAHVWRARTATISTHGASPVVADSANLGSGAVRLRVLPSALRLVRP